MPPRLRLCLSLSPQRQSQFPLRNSTICHLPQCPKRTHSSVSTAELTHFSALASSWWDPVGPSRLLHLMNPLRHDFIGDCLSSTRPSRSPGRESEAEAGSGTGLKYLDIGCGGGIFAESIARTIPQIDLHHPSGRTQAGSITALDPSSTLIRIAQEHARLDPRVCAHLSSGRARYLNESLEDHISSNAADSSSGEYDVITLFEVLEHIDSTTSPAAFLRNCLRLLRPGGWLIGSTIARSWTSWMLNQVIAEAPWPVGVVPRGTHEWSKFVDPGEVKGWARDGLGVVDGREPGKAGEWRCTGVMYFPGLGWKMVDGAEDWGNYFWAVRRSL